MHVERDRPTDPEGLVDEDDLLEYEDYVEMITAISDEFRFRLVYVVRVLDGPTMAEIADAVDRPVAEVEPVVEELIDAGVLAEKMACIVDCDQEVYETSVMGQQFLESGPLALFED